MTSEESSYPGPLDDVPTSRGANPPRLQHPTLVIDSPSSPPDSRRPLTPPFPEVSDEPEYTNPSLRLVSNNDDFSAFLGSPQLAHDMRRHSSAALSPTLGVEEGNARQFSGLRRYSLIDAGPVPRRDLEDQQDTFEAPIPRRPRVRRDSSEAGSSRTSVSASRYSTFEEMGIKGFAMAKPPCCDGWSQARGAIGCIAANGDDESII